MDIEKLIEQLSARGLSNGSSLGYHSGLFDEAATALSTLQAENEKLREKIEDARLKGYAKGLSEMSEENEKLQAELEQMKVERDAAVALVHEWEEYGLSHTIGGMTDMERLTHKADFGLEDWEETLFFVKSDPNGAYNILDVAKYQGEPEFDEILKNVALRLAAYEDILGDDYDLDRLRELVEADRDGRCVIFRKGYGVVSEYEVDEEGFITRTATGVVTREEYDRVLKGDRT